MATTSTVHAQLIRYATNGDQVIVNLKSAGSDIFIDRSSNTKLPTTVTSAQTLANSLGTLAFKDSLAKGDVGLGNVDNTADANKSVKYATSAGSANAVAWGNVSGKPTTLSGYGITDGASKSHTHNYAGSSSAGGSASSAVKLATARTINGVSFDGSANISVTANPTENELVGKDLNEIKTPGFYFSGGSNTCTNKPSSVDAFGLIVFNAAAGYIVQICMEGNTSLSKTWYRQWNASAWSAWGYYYSTGFKPSKSDVGLGNVDNTADANKSVKYATSAGSANAVAWGNVSGKPSTYTPATHTHTASQITDNIPASKISGVLSISNIPAAAQERVYVAADDTARLKLTKDNVQNGDVVKVTSTGKMYFVVDDTKLTSEDGYMVFAAGTAASVAWANVTGKPTSYTPAAHTHNYAGSGSAGGSANSAVKLDTATAGSATQPVYFSGGKPVATTYTLGKSVPSNAVFTDTNTWRGVQNNLTSDATDQSLSAAQGKALKGLVDARLARDEWTAVVKGQTWSRLCKVDAKASVTGSAFLLNVYATRGNVVYNDTFMIKSHHSSAGIITKISGSKYGSVIAVRIVSDANGNCYVELKDTANSITNATTQSVNCTILRISTGAVTKYTAFTDGSTLPTDFKETASLTTNTNSLQGNLTWGEITGKPSTFAPSSHTHSYAGSASAGGSANSAVKLDTSAGSATQPVYFSGGKPVATTYTLGKSVPSDAKFTDTVYSHPSATAYASGLYKITTNNLGHVTAATAVTKADITALGIPGSDTNTDTKVTQTVVASSSYTNWRTVLWGASNSATEGFTPATTTDGVFANENLTYQPSSGTLRAKVFKGSLTGNASTASKLATARTVSGGTDITMSYSYDGSGNSSASIGYYSANISVGNTNNYPFHRFAKVDTITGSYVDVSSTFLITQDYTGGGYGIVRVILRTNNSGSVSSVEVKWIVRSGIAVDSVQAGLYNVYGKTYADVFFKTGGSYAGTVIRAITNGARGSIKRAWTLINSSEVNDTTTSDAKTSKEVYASIAAAGTALHNQAYTNIVSGTNAGAVSYSDTTGTANYVFDSNDKKSITFAYSKAAMKYADYTWMAAWNGYELRAINKDQFAQASHSHSAASSSANGFMSSTDKAKLDFGDIVYVSKTTPTKACIWVKLD